MRNLLRALISMLLSVGLLFGSAVSGAPVRVDLPDAPSDACGRYVDAFVGTGGVPWMCGMLSPAACAPFGCVRLGPDTCAAGGVAALKTNTSGYYYEHRHMLGFSFGRLSGTGARDYGMFRVTPIAGRRSKAAALAFSHAQETASPGYYAVYLPRAGALCEMTATAHAGVQRYTFRTGKDASLYVDASSTLSDGHTTDTAVAVDADAHTLTAEAKLFGTFTQRYDGLTAYLYAEWDADTQSVSATDTGVSLRFGGLRDGSVTLRAGISFVSAENAKENLLREVGNAGFDEVRAQTAAEWETRLGSVRIDADDETKTVFYTALYHTMIMPTDFTDADGTYLGFDGKAHEAAGFTYRTDMSLWDTVRNVHALYTLIAPDVQRDCIESLLRMAEQGGVLPRWPMGAGYAGSMFGNPANILLTESYLKGVTFDARKAYEEMKKASDGVYQGTVNRDGAKEYNEYGYLPDDMGYDDSVSKTLEYSWEDAALAALADALGLSDEAAYYAKRSQNYRNLWDAKTAYFRPKNQDGSWGAMHPRVISFVDDIFGTDWIRAYCEGSARQWRWGTTQDPDALVALFGEKAYFVRELDRFMRDAAPVRGAVDPGSGFWIGNQHDIHAPYLFNHADRADLTQKWVRWALRERFSADADGLDGNDDGGTLSAWYVFSAMGFYPIAGSDRYWIGSPCVDGASVTLPNGKTLRVTVRDQGKKNVYVSAVTLNGEALTAPFLAHSQIAQGGELVFTMTADAQACAF
jgi:predicted alpha-1,2-mannosidase